MDSVGFRLFVSIFVSTMAVFLGFTAWNEYRREGIWSRTLEEHAHQTSTVLESALRYGMLLNRKEDLPDALKRLANEPGVSAIRIFNKHGKVAFSSHEAEVGRRFSTTDAACSSCHEGDAKGLAPLLVAPSRTFRQPDGELVTSHAHAIENSADCSNAECHKHPADQKFLGVLELRTSMSVVDEGRRAAEKNTLYTMLTMALVGGLVTAVFIWLFVRRPVQLLVDGTRRVAAAHLDTRIAIKEKGEFREIGNAFNRMTEELEHARKRTQQWEAELQSAVLQKTNELRRAHAKLMQMEKMASLGKLAATVAHELNNPLAGILVYSRLIGREMQAEQLSKEDREQALRHIEVIRQESARCGDIVKNLLTFARQSKADLSPCSLSLTVERSVQTVQHLLKHAAVDLRIQNELRSDQLLCDGNQLQQALVALLVNAVEAMPTGGELTLTLREAGESVEIALRDKGIGISPDVLPHIFEPFVSTKEEKGVGLGLSVVYGIVRRHGGQIEVESELDKGTTFRMLLPRNASEIDQLVEPHRLAANGERTHV